MLKYARIRRVIILKNSAALKVAFREKSTYPVCDIMRSLLYNAETTRALSVRSPRANPNGCVTPRDNWPRPLQWRLPTHFLCGHGSENARACSSSCYERVSKLNEVEGKEVEIGVRPANCTWAASQSPPIRRKNVACLLWRRNATSRYARSSNLPQNTRT